MEVRVYISRMDDVLTGVVSEKEYQRAEEYREFFRQQDKNSSGSGMYEVTLGQVTGNREQPRDIVARFEADSVGFGYYGHEGWSSCVTEHSRDVDGTRVVIDSMIPYYVVKSEQHEDEGYHQVEPDKDSVYEVLHEDDIHFLEELLSEERRERMENN